MKKHQAFSLLEVSAVVIIIGLLITGLVVSNGLIKSSRISNARSITTNSVVPKIEGLLSWHETSMKESFSINQAIDGAQITNWYDINPSSIATQRNTLTASASNSVIYESSGINKLPSVKFNASGLISLNSHYQNAANTSTVFVVFRPMAVSTDPITIFDGGSGGNRSISFKDTGIGLYVSQWAWTGTTTYPANLYSGKDYIIAAYYNNTSSAIYFDSINNKAGNANINPGGFSVASGLTIGGNSSSNYRFNGLVSEIIIYNRILSTQERKDVVNYLVQKYAIVIS